MIVNRAKLTRFERFASLFTRIRPGEGRSLAWLCLHAFLLMCAYYISRTSRETFIILEGSAELRSYASGIQAVLLLFMLPLYGMLFRLRDRSLVIQRIQVLLAFSLFPFYVAHQAGWHIGFTLFIWNGIMAVLVTSQFWAFATDLLNPKTGQRLFAIIAMGVSLGALAGSILSRQLIPHVGADGLLAVAALVFMVTLPLSRLSSRSLPASSRAPEIDESPDQIQKLLGGLAVVFRDRYLVMIALIVILMNWTEATGEYLLNDFLKTASMDLPLEEREVWIGQFQAGVMLWVTFAAAVAQLALVSRIILAFGIPTALSISPVVFILAYVAMFALPVIALVKVATIVVKSLDYSLLNTCRNTLFLPTNRTAKYEGKTAIDTLIFRLGDLLTALTVWLGIGVLGWQHQHFIALNIALSALLLAASVVAGNRYNLLAASPEFNSPPRIKDPIPGGEFRSGQRSRHAIPREAFVDEDAGDVLTLRARLSNGQQLPPWIHLDPYHHRLELEPPAGLDQEVEIEIIALDCDGLWARQTFSLRFYGADAD